MPVTDAPDQNLTLLRNATMAQSFYLGSAARKQCARSGAIQILHAEAPEGVLAVRHEFLLHGQHPVPTQKRVHLGLRNPEILNRQNKDLQLHSDFQVGSVFGKYRDRCAGLLFACSYPFVILTPAPP